MKQMELFQTNEIYKKLYRSKESNRVYTIQSMMGGVCRCESYPRSKVEEVCDITYLIRFSDLEEIA